MAPNRADELRIAQLLVFCLAMLSCSVRADETVVSSARASLNDPPALQLSRSLKTLPVVPRSVSDPALSSELAAPLSLAVAIRLAIEESHTMLSTQLDRDVQQQELAVTEAAFAPKFLLSGQVGRGGSTSNNSTLSTGSTLNLASGAQLELTRNRTTDTAGAPTSNTVLQIVQPLLKGNGSVATLGVQGARLNEAIYRWQYQQLQSDTVVAVVLAYFDATQADVQVKLAQQALQRSREILSVNQALYQAGRLAQRDLLQADLDIAQNELTVAQARNSADQIKRNLLQLLGPAGARMRTDQLVLADGLPEQAVLQLKEDALLAQARSGREDLHVAELALALARSAIVQANNDGLPQVDLIASVQSPGQGGVEQTRSGSDYSVGLRFTVPLDRGPIRLQRSRARVGLQKAEWALEDLRLEINNQVRSAVRDVRFAERQLELAQRSFGLAQQRLSSELQKLKAGRSSTFELSATQDALKQAQAALATAQLAVPRARIQLQKVTGQVLAQWLPLNTDQLSR